MRVFVSALVVALIAAGCGGSAATRTPAPAATAPVTTSASASSATSSGPPELPPGDSVPPGTYTLDRSVGVTVEVPAGWGAFGRQVITKNDFLGLYYQNLNDGIVVYMEPCTWASGGQTEPRGAEAIATALSAQQDREASQPRDVTVGGLPGVHVRLSVPADQAFTGDEDHHSFTGCDRGEFRTYTTTGGGTRYHQGPAQVDDLYLVDVEGGTVVFILMSSPNVSAPEWAELEAMLASVRID